MALCESILGIPYLANYSLPKDLMMTQLTQELTNLINLLESRLPANPRAPENVRKAERLERKVKGYFKALEQAFPYDAVEMLYLRHVKED